MSKTLHILYPEKFFTEYIRFVNDNFNPEDHLFLYLKKNGSEPKANNVKGLKFYRLGPLFYWELLQYFKQCDRVVLHSLAKSKVIYFLFLFKKFRQKCCWFLWGGDLYYRMDRYQQKIHNPIAKSILTSVIQELGAVATHVHGDVELARTHFGFAGKHINCFLYPSNLFKSLPLEPKKDSGMWILLGNSSHPSNNHIEALDKIAYLKNDNVKIVCPLSYGDARHAKVVSNYGKKIFGEKFMALTAFMPLQEYIQLLSKIDVAIFNHKRQQALGNIISLVGLGKTVYLRNDITSWQMLKERKIRVFDFKNITTLQLLDQSVVAENIEVVKAEFSSKNLSAQSTQVFNWTPVL